MGTVVFVLTYAVSASAGDPASLAPGPEQVAAARAKAELLAGRAEAIGRATERVQNRFAERVAEEKKRVPCEDADLTSLAARARLFGIAWRDAAQSTRAQVERLEELMTSPTVEVLLGEPEWNAALGVRQRSDRQVATYLEAATWQRTVLDPMVARCRTPLTMAVPGLSRKNLASPEEVTPVVAVIAVGGGRLCPDDQPADGSVYVLEDGLGCYGATACDCEPQIVLPGAVLGPPPPPEPAPALTPVLSPTPLP